jgi:hypothetical protein
VQFGAALDIVFTGSVEHLEDQVCSPLAEESFS